MKSLLDCGLAHALPGILFLTAFLGLVLWAAISDARGFRIPNAVSLALTALFFVRLLFVTPQAGLKAHLLTAAIAFSVLFAFFLAGKLGGGDTKLISAILLWTGPVTGMQFIVALALAGGVFAGFLWTLAKALRVYAGLAAYVPWPRLTRWARHGVLPYSLPIFVAALLVSPRLLEEACR